MGTIINQEYYLVKIFYTLYSYFRRSIALLVSLHHKVSNSEEHRYLLYLCRGKDIDITKVLESIFPFIFWGLIIAGIYIFCGWDLLLVPKDPVKDRLFLIGNTFFSIASFYIIVRSYKKNIALINNWLGEGKVLGKTESIIMGINRIHDIFFIYFQYFIIVGIILRRLIASHIYTADTSTRIYVGTDSAGIIIIDTMTMFFIGSLIVNFLGCIALLFYTSSRGIKLQDPFQQIEDTYRVIVSLASETAFLTAIDLVIFSIAVDIMMASVSGAIGLLINVLVLIPIPIAFIIGISGVHKGIIKTKELLCSEISNKNVCVLHELLRLNCDISGLNYDINYSTSINNPLTINLVNLSEILSIRYKQVHDIKEWIYDTSSLRDLIISLILTTGSKTLLAYIFSSFLPRIIKLW